MRLLAIILSVVALAMLCVKASRPKGGDRWELIPRVQAAYTTTVTVTTYPATPSPPPLSECPAGSAFCCNSVQPANTSAMATALGLLGVFVSPITALCGTGCTPISTSAPSCTTQPVCCQNNYYAGVVNIGCRAISLSAATPAPAPAPASCTPSVGSKVAFKADTGKFYARCNSCQKSVNNSVPDTIAVNGTAPSQTAVFTVVDAGGGKLGLRADNGKYVARCNGCIVGAPADMLTVHATAPSPITFEKTSSGKCALKANNGKYVGRCRSCSSGATTPDTVSVQDTDLNKSTVQLEIITVQ